MFLCPRSLKSINSIENMQPVMMHTTFNGNSYEIIISCYSPANVSDETNITTFNTELSSLVGHINKHNILIIGGDIYAHLGKNGNNALFLQE